jgi:hypothetical protein
VKRLLIAVCSVALFGAYIIPSDARTIDFDPPNFTAGQVVTTVDDATFLDNPVVFAPSQTTTFSPPNALHSAQSCIDNPCSNGAYMLRINFAKPMATVSLRAGSYGATNPNVCFPENDSCVVNARLVGYDASQLSNSISPQGNAVSDSGDVNIGDYLSGPITTKVKTEDQCGRIRFVILFVGKGIISRPDGGPTRAQIDQFSYTVADNPKCTTHLPPSITIASPQPNQSFSYPYQVTLAGTVTAPGGLFAFCTQINNTALPPASQCNQRYLLSANGKFSLPISLPSLQPGTNTLSVFAYDLSGQSGSASVSIFLQNPPLFAVTISEPTPGEQFSSSAGLSEVGSVLVPGGLLAFCTGANESTPPTPAQCNQTNSVDFFPSTGQGWFFYVPVPASMLVPGVNTLDAWVFDRWGQRGEAHVTVILPADPRVIGMEVTQGIQTTSIPLNTPGTPVPYSGVKLYFGGKTVVRVFANTPAGVLPGVPAALYATQGTGLQTRDLGLVFPDNGPRTLNPGERL